ncbi:Gfo/Idh/MocA family protein [Niabella drilacis]|uniref:Predicted dehydrogenase n=1 Tax=Niabella drilacis (strain DSM 25811 / CCM 8410 / CCUG 62505 / LMG 26954 / E90) TaxID=1285928 RepID=A0A1G6XY14_NIADE|nr:Gfo/Idh/MocA family oxidoreductase [Niabella drilacis]SDD82912.1 Predicted dehydrogenase [Niabella drilacis]
MHSRRKFIAQSSALALGGLALQSFNTRNFSRTRTSAADQIRIGAIGINGMGWADTVSMLKNPGVTLAALCDVDKNVLDNRMRELSKMNIDTSKIKTYTDYRSLLDRKDIDAVIIGTPDHWHALIMIHAVQAGKDVYVEKPVGNSIAECRAMVAAQEKYNKVVQAGQWQRSQQHFRDAVDFIRSGQLGNIRTVKVWCYQGWMKPGPKVADSAPPAGVDYKLWLGPAKTRPFNSSRFHFNFRWFWDYAGGLMTDWGVHLMDYAIFGMDAPVPKTVSALGGDFAYPELYQETPDTLAALYQFDNFNLIWDHAMGIDNGLYGKDHGIAFIGNNATLELDRGGWEVLEEKRSSKKVSMQRKGPSDNGLDKHTQNFINVVRSRKLSDLNCPIQTGAHIATVCQMGNIAYRSQAKVTWDKAANKFTDSKLNAAYLMAPYHNGYTLPKI